MAKSTDGGKTWKKANSGLRRGTTVQALAVDSGAPQTLYSGTSRGVFKTSDGGDTWSETGLTDQSGLALAMDPTDPRNVFVGTHFGVFKTNDAGETWTRVSDGLPIGSSVRALAIDPLNPQILLAGMDRGYSSGDGVYKSTDGGANWVEANTGDLADLNIYALAIDPVDTNVVYAAAFDTDYGPNGGIFQTVNGGEEWARVLRGPSVLSLALNPRSPQTAYAGTLKDGVLKSTLGGPWRKVNEGLDDHAVNALVVSPLRPATVYAGTDGGVYKTLQAGVLWRLLTGVVIQDQVLALAVHPSAPETVYAGTYGDGLYKSTDGARNWVQLAGVTDGYVYDIAIDPSAPDTVYVGTYYGGVFKSTDGGATWAQMNNGLAGAIVTTLAVDPSSPSTVYAGLAFNGVFKSTDGGDTWVSANEGLYLNSRVEAIVVDPTDGQTIYAGQAFTSGSELDGVYKSVDGGVSWFRASRGIGDPPNESYDRSTQALAIDPSDPATLYAAAGCNDSDICDVSAVYKTTNEAEQWEPAIRFELDIRFSSLAVDPALPRTVFAGHDHQGVYVTTDSGATWTTFNDGLADDSVHELVITQADPLIMYAGTNTGVFKYSE